MSIIAQKPLNQETALSSVVLTETVHSLNNLLTAVVTNADLALQKNPRAETAAEFEEIKKAAFKACALAKNLENISSPGLRRHSRIGVETTVQSAIKALNRLLEFHGGSTELVQDQQQCKTLKLIYPKLQRRMNRQQVLPFETLEKASLKIMLVEDNVSVGNVTKRILQSMGHSATLYSDAGAALREFQADPAIADLVILDVIMPNTTGMELYEKMQQSKAKLPVLFVTGFINRPLEDFVDTLEENTVAILQKPYTSELLEQTLRELTGSN